MHVGIADSDVVVEGGKQRFQETISKFARGELGLVQVRQRRAQHGWRRDEMVTAAAQGVEVHPADDHVAAAGIVSSGCPLYPAAVACVDAPWAIAAETATLWRRSDSFMSRAFVTNMVIMTAGFMLFGYQLNA